MDLYRLTPTALSNVKSSYSGSCAACGAPVKRKERVVHMYGEAFHSDCAFYRPLRDRSRGGGRARPA